MGGGRGASGASLECLRLVEHPLFAVKNFTEKIKRVESALKDGTGRPVPPALAPSDELKFSLSSSEICVPKCRMQSCVPLYSPTLFKEKGAYVGIGRVKGT
jgi:hypothetical protein